MKKIILLLLIISMAACQPKPTITEPNITDVTRQIVLEQFALLDNEYKTDWHEEKIPDNMIELEAIEPWTARMIFLKDRIQSKNDTTAEKLIDARIDMLKSQLAYYLMLKTGKEGQVNITENTDCKNVKIIAKALGLYNTAHTNWYNFTIHMDAVLQDEEMRELIGADDRRPKFYKSYFGNAKKYIEAVQQKVYKDCEVEIVMQDKIIDLQPDEVLS
ncbi:hypothetical protein KY309_03085 [Candidatus Woesearchaeota archaeon]|nr:hypothetical protein [Candidatus Woesearchaeota archaeon]MBW3016571.1 hypothetical protein [Candidatus Woesearchaeota archaeon]